MDRSLLDVGGAVLCVSQFTLYGDTRRGLRPSFTEAAEPAAAERLYDLFCERLARARRAGRDGALRSPDVSRAHERGPRDAPAGGLSRPPFRPVVAAGIGAAGPLYLAVPYLQETAAAAAFRVGLQPTFFVT